MTLNSINKAHPPTFTRVDYTCVKVGGCAFILFTLAILASLITAIIAATRY